MFCPEVSVSLSGWPMLMLNNKESPDIQSAKTKKNDYLLVIVPLISCVILCVWVRAYICLFMSLFFQYFFKFAFTSRSTLISELTNPESHNSICVWSKTHASWIKKLHTISRLEFFFFFFVIMAWRNRDEGWEQVIDKCYPCATVTTGTRRVEANLRVTASRAQHA